MGLRLGDQVLKVELRRIGRHLRQFGSLPSRWSISWWNTEGRPVEGEQQQEYGAVGLLQVWMKDQRRMVLLFIV